jgi:hypothetical protein
MCDEYEEELCPVGAIDELLALFDEDTEQENREG